MDSKHIKQYNAAMSYLEKNEYRIKKSNSIFFMTIIGIVSFIMVQFSIKYYNCLVK